VTQQTPSGNAIAVTFVLAFEPLQSRLPAVVDTLVRGGPQPVSDCAGLFERWHASRHFALGLHSELWFRFSCSPSTVQTLATNASAHLRVMGGTYGFALKDAIVEPEARAFGEGDLRPGYNIVARVGGPQGLLKLCEEVQQASKWAIADIRSGTIRSSLPTTWFDWSGHIYRNLLGLE